MAFIEEAKRLGRITDESIALGQQVARMSEKAVADLAAQGEPDERCATCAFRPGTPPNQCGDTLIDAMKCVVEKEPFMCHESKRSGWPCHGWFASVVATKDMPKVIAPWPYSHDEGAAQ